MPVEVGGQPFGPWLTLASPPTDPSLMGLCQKGPPPAHLGIPLSDRTPPTVVRVVGLKEFAPDPDTLSAFLTSLLGAPVYITVAPPPPLLM